MRSPALFLAIMLLAAPGAAEDMGAGGILVKYKGPHTAAANEKALGHGVFLVDPPNPSEGSAGRSARRGGLSQGIGELSANPEVEYVEADSHGSFESMPLPAASPNDPGYPYQGWLDTIAARQAWAVSTGDRITVAVIDSGVDLHHPDLQGRLRADGYNFGDGNASPQDALGHGTFVAGLIAAHCGNGLDGCGLAPMAKILPIKINPGYLNDFKASSVVQAIDYALARGARVLNLSLSIAEESKAVSDTIQRAIDAGAIVVVAAGNNDPQRKVKFPATVPGVIAVAGTSLDGKSLWEGSSLGPEVAVAAPATGGVYSTLIGGGFGAGSSGTSYSAPIVAAAAADMLALDGGLSGDRMRELLKKTAHPLSGGSGAFGTLDAGAALLAMLPDFIPNQAAYTRQDRLGATYSLPPVAEPVDIYLGLKTPYGTFPLNPDGSWSSGEASPLVRNYRAAASAEGEFYGPSGAFPTISLNGLPPGEYVWSLAFVDSASGEPRGPIIESTVVLR